MAKSAPVAFQGGNLVVDGDNLVITVSLSEAAQKAASPSASGKTRVVATTRGNVAIAGTQAKIGLNVYVPNGG